MVYVHMPRKDTLNEKVVCDCYELLHQVSIGHSSMQELSEKFGVEGNKAESNYRQVERIKLRCQKAGIDISFDPTTMRFRTSFNAKLEYLEKVLPKLKSKYRRNIAFGFFAEKVSSQEVPYPVDEQIE